MLNLIQGREFDVRKFAEALEKNAQEAVKWERRKLEWILDEERQELEQAAQQGAGV